MKVLITGGAGFIGSNLTDRCVELGHEVIVIDNLSADCHEKFYFNREAVFYKLDICDYNLIEPLFEGVDVVFHVAAEARIQPAILNPLKAVQTNVLGTANVLQAARKHNVKRVIYSSTSSAYGLKNIPPLEETMPRDCLNPYSVSKCAGEDLCKMYTELFGLETVIFRYFNVIGKREPIKGVYAPVVGLFLRQWASEQPMTIVGTGLQRRDFSRVEDVVKANVLAADISNKRPVGEIINVGTGKNHSVLELAKMIGDFFVYIPERPGEAFETLANNTKAKELLGWSPEYTLEDWVESEKERLSCLKKNQK